MGLGSVSNSDVRPPDLQGDVLLVPIGGVEDAYVGIEAIGYDCPNRLRWALTVMVSLIHESADLSVTT